MVRRILPLIASLFWAGSALAADVSLLNVSYDPTRETLANGLNFSLIPSASTTGISARAPP